MARPNFRRMWVAELEDGSIVSRFDKDGIEHSWERDYRRKVDVRSIRYEPISPSLVSKIIEKGNMATALPLETFVFDVPEGADVEIFTRNFLTIVPHYHCFNCGNVFDLDEDNDVVCPKCFAKNEWYCPQCDCLDDNPIVVGNGEVRCSRCEKTRNICGLTHVVYVNEFCEEVHDHFHILRINDNEYHIYDDRVEQ